MQNNLEPSERRAAQIAGLAIVAALLSLWFFSPRFVYWRLLPVSLPAVTSEVIRAKAALVQLDAPFAPIADDNNRVLEWRLLFPLVGHAFELPPAIYLALPHAGALLVLFFAAWLFLKHGIDWGTTLAALCLLATCSWFFASTGWLGYFDSWLVLGMLAVVFAPGLAWVVVAVVLTPWVDERFVIALPLLWWLRQNYRLTCAGSPTDDEGRRGVVCLLLALAPWLAIRLGVYAAGHDATTKGYVDGLIARQSEVPAKNYVLGLWHGARWSWLMVAAWLAIEWRGQPRRVPWLMLLFFGTVLVNLFIASDVSRSMVVLVPVVMLGALLARQQWPRWAGHGLRAACVLNLVFPAMHVSGAAAWKILPLSAELAQWRHPPPPLTPLYYVQQAAAFHAKHKTGPALRSLTHALELDPKCAEAYQLRATINYGVSRDRAALADANAALALQPNNPVLRNDRACIRAELGDVAGAIADFEEALRLAPPAWPLRAQAQANLAALRTKSTGR